MTQTVNRPKFDSSALHELAASFRGPVIRPSDAAYEEQRHVWNGSIDRHPALILGCAGVADVIAALKLAERTGPRVAVRSGGHSFPGLSVCDDGMVIDLSRMKGIRVDSEARTVRAQAGVLLGELDRETQAFGMAVPAGIVTHTGLAGLTLGGGVGWLMRKYGLTIDQLLSVDVVTARGEFIKANERENADLFWGVRGGGGNFGIITEFEFRLNPVGPIVLGGPLVWPIEQSDKVLHLYRDWITDVPDDLTTIVVHRTIPPLPLFPSELHGKRAVMLICCYAGPVDQGEHVLRSIRSEMPPILDLCTPKPYVEHQAMFDPSFPHGWWYYFKSRNLEVLSDEVIDVIAGHASRSTSPLTAFPIFQLGGAIEAVGEDDTAYSGRSAGHMININATTATGEGFEEERAWSRNFWEALEPYDAGAYVNFLMEEGEQGIQRAYGRAKYGRLKALKARYDPDNVFQMNQNILPEVTSSQLGSQPRK